MNGGLPLLDLGLLLGAGLVAGYVNAIAGAGSLLTLPALIFTGLDPVSANATNRVAVLFQTGAAVTGVRRAGHRFGRAAWLLTIPATVGGVLGAAVAGRASQDAIRLSIALAMPVFLVLGLIRPRHREEAPSRPLSATPALGVAFFGFGVYAGYLQAGVGVLVLLVLDGLYRVDLIEANGAKLLSVGTLTVAALGTFLAQGVVIDPIRGATLALATTLGGYAGATASVRRGSGFIRLVLTVVVLVSAVKLVVDATYSTP